MTSGVCLERPSGICRLCGATSNQRAVGRERKLDAGQWLIWCGECGGGYLDPGMGAEALARFYADDYRRLFPFEAGLRADRRLLYGLRVREVALRRARALAHLAGSGNRVLEIGSGHGAFPGRLHPLRPDLSLHAVEPDTRHRELALDGAPVRFLSWDEVGSCAPYHLIVLFHSLEHLQDPADDLRLLAGSLDGAGRMVIEVPRIDPAILDWSEVHPAHACYFTRASLERLLERAGLDVLPPRAAGAGLPGCLWVEAGIGSVPPAPVLPALPCRLRSPYIPGRGGQGSRGRSCPFWAVISPGGCCDGGIPLFSTICWPKARDGVFAWESGSTP